MMKRLGVASLALAIALPLAFEMTAVAASRDGPRTCLAILPDADRLSCYDREVRKLIEPRFAGRLSMVTERFKVDVPTLLRFQSDGAIFVLYLKTGDDEMVQNLHIGGGGEDTYLIEKPGTYFLQINGSEGWRIWLEPRPVAKSHIN